MSFGTPYDIEIFEEGFWYEIPFKDEIDFTMNGLELTSGETYKKAIDLKTLKYELMPGEYRVIKRFNTKGKEIMLSAIFHLE